MLGWTATRRLMLIAAAVLLGVQARADVRIQGAGATFPNPLYQRWTVEYQRLHPGVRIDYQSIGSGGGVRAITQKTVQFAGSDARMSQKDFDAAGGKDRVVEIPTVAGAVVPAYNVPGVSRPLNLSGELIADIYTGRVATWDDLRIAELNPGVALPAIGITPAWRTDGSGTTYVFTSYLATQSFEFRTTIGRGKAVRWPIGQGGKGNEGVAAVVLQTPGAFGYVELNYALQNKIPFGAVRNQAGNFIIATPETVSAAGEGVADQMSGATLAVDLWNQPGERAYPISAFTYIITYRDMAEIPNFTHAQAKALVEFLWWATHEGQSLAVDMDYAPLADPVRARVARALHAITYRGTPLLTPAAPAPR